ncbi:unnamed protein product [Paramecium pentaurelia]|uniref:Uncharacterized protein n=1 Tax=Paramecium pentaurelia TaxID=43138 RepID=A0A8S1VF09_9CILI|nr:unnamed protein product [Paramecium pentaurelia]
MPSQDQLLFLNTPSQIILICDRYVTINNSVIVNALIYRLQEGLYTFKRKKFTIPHFKFISSLQGSYSCQVWRIGFQEQFIIQFGYGCLNQVFQPDQQFRFNLQCNKKVHYNQY